MDVNNYDNMNIIRSSTGQVLGSTAKTGNKWQAVRYDENGTPSRTRRFTRQSAAMRFATVGS